jgi:UDP-N-acetylglucosamine transferase subunit ALG13
MALPYLATAAAARAEVHWIESATRRTGPSTTGRLIQHLPGVSVHHQGFTQPQGRWRPTGNVFDGFRSVEQDPREVRRVVVSVGTERFPFSRIFDCISRAALDHADTVWQTGHTQVSGLPGTARTWIPADELNAAVEAADLVVTHAGVGSVLTALRAGRYPLIFPRLRALGEHIDDHQVELASLLQERGLATVVTSADVDLQAVLEQCARRRIVAVQAAPIRLSAALTGRP